MAFWTQPSLHPKTKSTFLVTFGTGFTLRNIKSIDKPSVEISKKEVKLINHHFNYPGIAKWQPIKMTFIDMNGAGVFDETTTSRPTDTAKMLFHMLKNSGYYYPDPSNDLIYNTTNGHRLGLLESDTIAADTTITSPEKSSTIANSFGDGLSATSNYDASQATPRAITIQQFGTNTDLSTGPNITGLKNKQQVETWKLVNPIITNISWGNLSYEEDAFVEYTLDVSYDWAEFYTESIPFDSITNGTDFDQFDADGEYSATKKIATDRAQAEADRRAEEKRQLEQARFDAELGYVLEGKYSEATSQFMAQTGTGGSKFDYNAFIPPKLTPP